jgi:hypothetical protein
VRALTSSSTTRSPVRGDDRRGRHGGALLRRSLARAAGRRSRRPETGVRCPPGGRRRGQPARAPAGIGAPARPTRRAAVHEKACPLNRRLTKFGEAGSKAQEGMTSTPTRSPLGGRRSTTGRCRTTSPPRNSNSCRMPRSSPAPASSRWTRGLSSKATPVVLGASLGDDVEFETVIVPTIPATPRRPTRCRLRARRQPWRRAPPSRGPVLGRGRGACPPRPPGQRPPARPGRSERFFDRRLPRSLKPPSPDPPTPKDGTAGKGGGRFQELSSYLERPTRSSGGMPPVVLPGSGGGVSSAGPTRLPRGCAGGSPRRSRRSGIKARPRDVRVCGGRDFGQPGRADGEETALGGPRGARRG